MILEINLGSFFYESSPIKPRRDPIIPLTEVSALKQSFSIGVFGGSITGGLRSQFYPVIKRVSK